ncbi:MAG: DUF1415 domain-containing protein [Sulfuritalea sp.]|nr:DUF1415 domain-containing protein [Polynucleobacter sp.]MCF8187985.1 DUF1415 domain-containing protein [Sulfuritalea sp.]
MNSFLEADTLTEKQIIAYTSAWVEHVVIGLNLCPFAKPVHTKGQIDYFLSHARDETTLAADLRLAMQRLIASTPEKMDTCLLIHPWVLSDFFDYNNFLDIADGILDELELIGVLQIASFHPHYQFAGTTEDDVTNCTNRSPFPMLHLLREKSLDKATAALPDANVIVDRNVDTMISLGNEGWNHLQSQLKQSIKSTS